MEGHAHIRILAPMGTGRRAPRIVISACAVVVALVATALPGASAVVIYQRPPIRAWQTNGTVYEVRIVGTTVYVGGSFSEVRAQGRAQRAARANLAAFDVRTGELISGFRADTDGPVRALRPSPAGLLVGGRFRTIGGVARSRLARVDPATGAVAAWAAPDIDGPVQDIRVAGDRVIVAGNFTVVGGQPRGGLAALVQATGTLDGSWVANTDGNVQAVSVSPDGSEAYVAGRFRSVNGLARRFIAALSARDGAVLRRFYTWPREFLRDLVLSPDGDMLYGACRCNKVIAWKAAGGRAVWMGDTVGGDVQAVTYRAGSVYFGFHDGAFGNKQLRLLAADGQTGTTDAGFRPVIDTFFGVMALDASGAALVAGGTFKNVDGDPAQGFAIFPAAVDPDTSAPSAPGTPTVTAGPVLTWAPSSDDLAVEGYVIRRNGVRVGYSNTNRWVDRTPLPDANVAYTVTAVDPARNRSAVSQALHLGARQVVRSNAVWRYDARGRDLGTTWRNPDFPVRSWPMARAGVGFAGPGLTTLISPTGLDGAPRTTTYFRRNFKVTDAGSVVGAMVTLRRDDGAVVYLNGVEVLRSNMPAGPVNVGTRAVRPVRAKRPAAQTVMIPLPTALLAEGRNTLAVEVHQAKDADNDLVFAATLQVYQPR